MNDFGIQGWQVPLKSNSTLKSLNDDSGNYDFELKYQQR